MHMHFADSNLMHMHFAIYSKSEMSTLVASLHGNNNVQSCLLHKPRLH